VARLDIKQRSAVISECGTYRYELRRVWDESKPLVGWVLLNPSTADAESDDATLRRCMGFAAAWGAGGVVLRNLFALRARDPRRLAQHPDPVGPDNDEHLARAAREDVLTVCGWGARQGSRPFEVVSMLRGHGARLRCLGTTKGGQPRHPLYLPASASLVPYTS
jgi:hypothetical protein